MQKYSCGQLEKNGNIKFRTYNTPGLVDKVMLNL